MKPCAASSAARSSRVKVFRHRTFRVELPKAEGHRARIAERPRERFGVEPEEPPRRHCRAEDAASRCVVKVVVVLRADGRAEADRDLEAGYDRGEQLSSVPPITSEGGQRGGDDDGAGMDDRDAVDIIHLDDVRKRAVRERRRLRRSAHGLTEDE